MPRCALSFLRCAGLDTSAHATWADVAELCLLLDDLRRSAPATARRGDEASLELCAQPLYWNARNVLRPRGNGPLDDDQELVSLAAACRPADAARQRFDVVAERRPRFDEAVAALASALDGALDAKRGGGLTCAGLRKSAQLGTYATGSYVDDDGKFRPLDRALVEEAKTKLRDGKALEDDETPPAAPVASRAVVVADRTVAEPPTKRQRGGAILKLVKASRPPPSEHGP